MFKYEGAMLASKSWLNRALVVQYFNPLLKINGASDSEDVVVLKQAIAATATSNSFYLGQGGTSLRFFTFLISRVPGEWNLKAHSRLLERPQNELKDILQQLGVEVQFQKDEIKIKSSGWNKTAKIVCDAKTSSQFASGIVLSAWGLDFDLNIKIQKPVTSFEYLSLTLDLLKKAGMNISITEKEDLIFITIPANQKTTKADLQAELDVSSAFSLAAAAVVSGDVQITNWNPQSVQPDMVFLDLFKKMQINYQTESSRLKIAKHNTWKSLDANLSQSPDLFPVLSILCALAEGKSNLHGAAQLKFKESDRLKKTKELLDLAGFSSELKDDGLIIDGRSSTQDKSRQIKFNPDHDHRMAMAAGILKLAGYNIQIASPEVVNKSYPKFWQDIGVTP